MRQGGYHIYIYIYIYIMCMRIYIYIYIYIYCFCLSSAARARRPAEGGVVHQLQVQRVHLGRPALVSRASRRCKEELRGSQGRGFEHRSTRGFEHVRCSAHGGQRAQGPRTPGLRGRSAAPFVPIYNSLVLMDLILYNFCIHYMYVTVIINHSTVGA